MVSIAAFEMTSASDFVRLLLASRHLATIGDRTNHARTLARLAQNPKSLRAFLGERGLSVKAARLERNAADAIHFTHPGPARDDAVTVFAQVAPLALLDFDALAPDPLDAASACDQMVATIKASGTGHDFIQTALAERYFRTVALPALLAMT